KVLVIQPQFLQAGTGHIRELKLCFPGGAAGLAAFSDVLHTASRSLHHLIMGATALLNGAVTKAHGDVVNHPRDLEALQLPIAAMKRDERFRAHKKEFVL